MDVRDNLIRERIRALRAQGVPEEDAVKQAHKVDTPEEPDEELDDEETGDQSDDGDGAPEVDRQFVIVTKDFSGLGWAKKLDEEGEQVTVAVEYDEEDETEPREQMKQVGKNWLNVMELTKAVNTLQSDNTYWIFAENNFPEEAEKLRKAGQKVFGTSELSEKMEHDRDFGVEMAEENGLIPPVTEEFNSRDEALSFLDENVDKAYVLKLNDNKFNYQTFVPIRKKDADANREVYTYLECMDEEPGSFILQERIPIEEALEVNVEMWFYEGEPFLANVGLEVKRKNTYDLGEMSGCAGDFSFFVDMDTPLVQKTIAKLADFYREQNYTGFADVNVIFTKDNEPHFLEVCNRFGYNSHPNMFLALGRDTFGNIMADYMDGRVDDLRERFRDDIGCSLTMFLDHPRKGLPVHVDSKYAEQFYPFDGYKKGDQLLLTGYSNEVGIFVDHAETIEAAWKKVSEHVAFDEAVSFPDMYYRWDLADDNYYNAPVLRYKELKKRGLV